MQEHACWLAAGLSAVLAIFFWLPFGADGSGATGYAQLTGADLNPAPPLPASTSPKAVQAAMPQAATPLRDLRPAPVIMQAEPFAIRKKPASKGKPAPTTKRPSVASSAIAEPAVEHSTMTLTPVAEPQTKPAAPSPTTTMSQDYTLENIAEKFENDPSKYPLEHSRELNGITLGLMALGRLDRLSVLKISVANETEVDFFVKEFSIHVGAAVLGSRSLFRILVEPHRTRIGYVLFERPQSGTSVKIKLKEDGGQESTVDMPIPYPF